MFPESQKKTSGMKWVVAENKYGEQEKPGNR